MSEHLVINTKDLRGNGPGSTISASGSATSASRYHNDDEGSVSTFEGSEAASHTTNNLSTTSTQLMDNTAFHRSQAFSGMVSPGSTFISKNALVASRMLRSRRDRSRRTAAAQQLMERLVPERPSLVNPTEEEFPADSLRNRAKNRRRASGGGAFAKLMVQAPAEGAEAGKDEGDEEDADKEPESSDPKKERQEVIHAHLTSAELDGLRKQALQEFARGKETNKRYHAQRLDDLMEGDDDQSEASLPSILNRSEVFHENAAAAVLALLTPSSRGRPGYASVLSTSSMLDDAGLRVTPSKKGLMITAEHSTVSAFRGPSSVLNDSGSVMSTSTNNLDLSYEGHMPKSSITQPIMSLDAERALDTVKKKMRDPSKTLSDLLTAIATPDNGSEIDCGFMVRRKNACGALKVLTSTAANRRTMCWTVGVLPALTSVLEDTGEEGLLEAFPDHRTRAEYVEARKRAVASLVNLAVPKENRIPIVHSPGLVQAVCAVIVDDRDESRQGCCAIVAYLTKTQENRLLMVQVPGLLEALESVIAPNFRNAPPNQIKQQQKKNKYHWDDDEEEDDADDEIGDSFSTDFRNMSMATDGSDRYTVETGAYTYDTGSRGTSFRSDDDSDVTPQMSASPCYASKSVAQLYDQDPNRFLHVARKNVFASLNHITKEKDNAYAIARHEKLMTTLVEISKLTDSPSHTLAIKVIANMTRHRSNSRHIVFKLKIIVPAMVQATKSSDDEARLYALYALQNLSQDRSCRQEVANTKDLILSLCQRARQSKVEEEKLAAISSLKNLTDDPANLIPMSNTSECFATLMQLAHGSGVTEEMQYLACDALATLSHWLRKIATSGVADAEQPNNNMFVPSLKVVTWSQWE